MKPLLERKRRARINRCLDDLKDIMVAALQSEGESITKLEKADVLELTVRHLRKLKEQNALGLTPQATYAGRWRVGRRRRGASDAERGAHPGWGPGPLRRRAAQLLERRRGAQFGQLRDGRSPRLARQRIDGILRPPGLPHPALRVGARELVIAGGSAEVVEGLTTGLTATTVERVTGPKAGQFTLTVKDKKNPSSNQFSEVIMDGDGQTYAMNFKMENIKVVKDEYVYC